MIRILTCHENDFIAHPGWWAVMNDPKIPRGSLFHFEIGADSKRRLARCVRVIPPGHSEERDLLEKHRVGNAVPFRNWFVIVYEVVD